MRTIDASISHEPLHIASVVRFYYTVTRFNSRSHLWLALDFKDFNLLGLVLRH